ncbi:DNA polymerase III subunit gamma/tau [Vreelandella salicampi]|uniref:DNA polymerase III subunit gamma/tau n=1 Tax=Vreelandella salicampi TaxID=1449798 RepID=A0A7Z0LL26_9GAMM|nr:DNA polymerase III subunit gamma/tau [Halomonas salicampi]NYS60945.1 DNA polymerase III subunit gamma/tau [Halomonas salicampi]
MSYQVLARKWRPRTFHELVGQAHVQRALVNALDQGRLHHAYLFTGTRGVGKTTLARILAKCLNCTANGRGDEGVTSVPCGECDSCRAIDEGRFVDLIEVDAASRTKVEDTRELLDNVQYAPTQGRYKVYLIDEVHMLSTSSFNALLKTLEEPPPHVKFLLATTDPHKLPPTVLSRCLQFTLKHMPPERVVEHLQHVLTAEGVAFEESALWLLGKAAEGSMRDAMSLTDQAIAFGQGEVRHGDVAAMLGTLDHRHLLALVDALAEVDVARLLSEVAQLAEQGPDFAAVLDDVTAILHRLAVAQMVPDAVDNSRGDRETVLALASRFTAEDVQLYYQIGIQGRGDMVHAPDLRSALEMTLLRMLAFRPQGVPKPPQTPLPLKPQPQVTSSPQQAVPESSASAPASTEAPTPAPSSASEPPSAPEPPPWADEASAPPEPEPSLPEPEPAPELQAGPQPVPAPQPEPEPDVQPDPTLVAPSAAHEPVEPAQEGEPGRLTHAKWLAMFDALGLGGLTRNLAANCQCESDDGKTLALRLAPSQAAMQAEIHQTRIAKALSAQGIERQVTFYVEELDPSQETPHQREERQAQERHAHAVDTLSRDPHIQKLQQAFGAKLIESSVKPSHSAR